MSNWYSQTPSRPKGVVTQEGYVVPMGTGYNGHRNCAPGIAAIPRHPGTPNTGINRVPPWSAPNSQHQTPKQSNRMHFPQSSQDQYIGTPAHSSSHIKPLLPESETRFIHGIDSRGILPYQDSSSRYTKELRRPLLPTPHKPCTPNKNMPQINVLSKTRLFEEYRPELQTKGEMNSEENCISPKEKNDLSPSKITPFTCKECNVMCSSYQQYDIHCRSQAHRAIHDKLILEKMEMNKQKATKGKKKFHATTSNFLHVTQQDDRPVSNSYETLPDTWPSMQRANLHMYDRGGWNAGTASPGMFDGKKPENLGKTGMLISGKTEKQLTDEEVFQKLIEQFMEFKAQKLSSNKFADKEKEVILLNLMQKMIKTLSQDIQERPEVVEMAEMVAQEQNFDDDWRTGRRNVQGQYNTQITGNTNQGIMDQSMAVNFVNNLSAIQSNVLLQASNSFPLILQSRVGNTFNSITNPHLSDVNPLIPLINSMPAIPPMLMQQLQQAVQLQKQTQEQQQATATAFEFQQEQRQFNKQQSLQQFNFVQSPFKDDSQTEQKVGCDRETNLVKEVVSEEEFKSEKETNECFWDKWHLNEESKNSVVEKVTKCQKPLSYERSVGRMIAKIRANSDPGLSDDNKSREVKRHYKLQSELSIPSGNKRIIGKRESHDNDRSQNASGSTFATLKDISGGPNYKQQSEEQYIVQKPDNNSKVKTSSNFKMIDADFKHSPSREKHPSSREHSHDRSHGKKSSKRDRNSRQNEQTFHKYCNETSPQNERYSYQERKIEGERPVSEKKHADQNMTHRRSRSPLHKHEEERRKSRQKNPVSEKCSSAHSRRHRSRTSSCERNVYQEHSPPQSDRRIVVTCMTPPQKLNYDPQVISIVYGGVLNALAPGSVNAPGDLHLATTMIAELTKAAMHSLAGDLTKTDRNELRKTAAELKQCFKQHVLVPAFHTVGHMSIECLKFLALMDVEKRAQMLHILSGKQNLLKKFLKDHDALVGYAKRYKYHF